MGRVVDVGQGSRIGEVGGFVDLIMTRVNPSGGVSGR